MFYSVFVMTTDYFSSILMKVLRRICDGLKSGWWLKTIFCCILSELRFLYKERVAISCRRAVVMIYLSLHSLQKFFQELQCMLKLTVLQ